LEKEETDPSAGSGWQGDEVTSSKGADSPDSIRGVTMKKGMARKYSKEGKE